MYIKRQRGWEIAEHQATPEHVFFNRRKFLTGAAATTSLVAAPQSASAFFFGNREEDVEESAPHPTADLYPVDRNPLYTVERDITNERSASTYNNFYEFGSHKSIWRAAQKLETHPWTMTIDGMVETPVTMDFEEIARKLPLEERVYRHRCVEAWAMTVPWTGFSLSSLLTLAKPLGSAKYVRFETFLNPDVATGQRQSWYPWPYVEGLTIEEAANELTFMATGVYGKPLPKQFGAPVRLHTPWKYGFKCSKSITKITLTEERPVSFWEEIAPREYGFWANVNPEVPHPRWSQETEELLGEGVRVPTKLYNGYGAFVADLYKGKENEPLFM